jgi:translation initiation factor IF-3
MARDAEMDIVEVGANSNPPVCRIMVTQNTYSSRRKN